MLQQARELREICLGFRYRPTRIRRSRRAGKPHSNAPVTSGWYENERKQTADERLHIGPKALVKAAAVASRQENTASIRPMFELPTLRPMTYRREPGPRCDLRVVCQFERLDAAFFFVGDDGLDATAVTAAMTIPVLHHGQIA